MRYPLPYAFARSNALLLEDDGHALTLWPTSSFPSGHTGAAMALYGAIAILLLWIYGRSWKTQFAAFVLFCLPIVVAVSRLYRGMHHPSDVIAGAICGGLWLAIVMSTLLPRRKNMDFNNMPRTSLR